MDINNIICDINLNEIAIKKRNETKKLMVLNEVETVAAGITDTENDITFQILDWNTFNEETSEGIKKYKIRLFGRVKDGRTIMVQIEKYTPYFYIELPDNWRMYLMDILIDAIKKRVFPKDNIGGLVNYQIVSKHKFFGFTDYKKFNFLQLTFRDRDSMKSYERVFKKPLKIFQLGKEPVLFRLYESNIEPFIRCMHIRNIDAVGWVSISANKYMIMPDNPTISEINIMTDWNNLNRINDRLIQPYIIASFDIECTSGDGTFPQAFRDEDQIIQIGTTFMRFGESECFYQHIITLGTCDKIDDIDVESYETEHEVLLAWTNLIQRINPDIITGYNIVGFDLEYLKDRSKKLGIEDKFSKLTRIRNQRAEWKETKLASSALGVNILKYYDMTGRILIDMMKVIQRDYKIDSYKLDYAASYFIKEQIQKIINNNNEMSIIETKSTYGVKVDNYISITYNDGITMNKYNDGKKYKIIQISKNTIHIDGIIDNNIMTCGYKVYWGNAKDDISPKDIFRLQKGTSKDRALVAKYCIQDCALVNKLMSKLQVLTNNIGMANVCHVPLSYLFMRGQGVKIFSLVSKKCREKQHLIETLVKEFTTEEEVEEAQKEDKKIENIIAHLNGDEEDDEEDDSYEGAIVFPPKAGVYKEPIPVLDYASLYPRSMICRNLSHECCVIDDAQYGNVKNYKYNIISYMTSTLEQDYDRKLLNTLMKAYENTNDYVLEEQEIDTAKLRRHTIIYDKDHNGNKRWKISEITTNRNKIIITNYETSKFAEKNDGTKGIIPEILMELLNARSKYKDEMENEPDNFKKAILDGLQQAYKVTANSLYGQTGSSMSAICMKRIAASTTAVGREMLSYSKYFIENIYGKMCNLAITDNSAYLQYCSEVFKDTEDKKFNSPKKGWSTRHEFYDKFSENMNITLKNKTVNPYIVYGDSVPHDTPIILKSENNLNITEICNIVSDDSWQKYDNYKSEDAIPYMFNIIDILLGDKENYINDSNIIIHDAEDRDIILTGKHQKIMAECIMDRLKQKLPKIVQAEINKLYTKTVFINGNIHDIRKRNLRLDTHKFHDRELMIKQLKDTIIQDQHNRYSKEEAHTSTLIYTQSGWAKINRIIRHKTNKTIYRIITTTGACDVTEDHSLLDKDSKLIKPKDCTIDTELLYGYHNDNLNIESIGDNYNKVYFESTNKIECAKYYCWNKANNYNIIIDYDEKTGKYLMMRTMAEIIKPNKINKIILLDNITDYVYDIETEDGTFGAGIGDIIVSNTDSVFFNCCIKDNITGKIGDDKQALEQCINLGIWASHTICLLLPEPQEQCYEKVLWPFMILTKKRYVGNLYEKDPNKFYQKSMGIVLKRRDNAAIVKIVCGGIVDQILNKRDNEGAVKLTQRLLKEILSGKFPMDKFIITKTLRDNYKDRTRIVHAVLADRMAERDPGNKPLSNDRIPYAYIIVNKHVELQGERVEHPDYIISENLKLDYLFYITNQIQKPAMQFLELIAESPNKIFNAYIMKEQNRRKGVRPIKAYFGANNDDDDNDNDNESYDNTVLDDNVIDVAIQKKRSKTASKPKKGAFKTEDITMTLED